MTQRASIKCLLFCRPVGHAKDLPKGSETIFAILWPIPIPKSIAALLALRRKSIDKSSEL
jgi:hypothetical protein